MDKVNHIIAENLRRLRDEKKLSLEDVSKLSGVSKSMLGQIERGDVNPTVSTVWKIANGLKLSFTELMCRPEADIELIEKSNIQQLIEDDGKFRNFPVFPFDNTRRFEIYLLEIDGGGFHDAEAHPQGTQEFITVFSGEITISVGGQSFTIGSGNSIRFKADSQHSYKNNCYETCTLSMVIYYPQ